jgi:SAM-dependent methyltransferase
MLTSARAIMKTEGPLGLARAVIRRLRAPRAKSFAACRALASDKVALEIGGPSAIFGRTGSLPLYPLVRSIDNCNFGELTLWHGRIPEGGSFTVGAGGRNGQQFIREATDLHGIPDGSYDLVLASHMLEHSANPLAALREWSRVLRPGGAMVVIVPDRKGTFDHRRPVTALSHLIEDLENGTKEDDLAHLPEILELHDIDRDPGVKSLDEFRERASKNHENRCLHHHVFDAELIVNAVGHVGLQASSVEALAPFHLIAVARKA